jgi:hypothetical protein
MIKEENTKSATTMNVTKGSTLPCPKGCLSSDGFVDILNPKYTIKEERMSEALSIASAINAKECPKIPAVNFPAANNTLTTMLSKTVFFASLVSIYISDLPTKVKKYLQKRG